MDLADELETDEQLVSLMLALNFSAAEHNRTRENNRLLGRVSTQGTRDMLFKWRQRTEIAQQRSKMEAALTEAKLLDLRDRMYSRDYEDDTNP